MAYMRDSSRPKNHDALATLQTFRVFGIVAWLRLRLRRLQLFLAGVIHLRWARIQVKPRRRRFKGQLFVGFRLRSGRVIARCQGNG